MAQPVTHTTAQSTQTESDMCKCNTCQVVKRRIIDGKIGGQVAFKDEHGKRWQRRKCPECYKKQQLLYRAKERKELAQANAPRVKSQAMRYSVIFAPGVVARKCKRCENETANYYYCASCYTTMRYEGNSGLSQAEFLYG